MRVSTISYIQGQPEILNVDQEKLENHQQSNQYQQHWPAPRSPMRRIRAISGAVDNINLRLGPFGEY